MVNVNKLKGKIVENELTVEEVADKLGINRSTFYRKLNNSGETFLIKEADKLVNLLHLSASEATAIFFSQFVA